MDYIRLPTAPLWSAEAIDRIDRLPDTHTPDDSSILGEVVTELAPLLERLPMPTAVDHLLARAACFVRRAELYAAVATLAYLGMLRLERLAWPGWQHDDGTVKRRLRPLEMALVRLVALPRPVAALQVGLLEAGCSSGELALVAHADVTVAAGGEVLVQLPGCGLATPRRVRLGSWVAGAMAVYLVRGSTAPLVYTGQSSEDAKQQSCVLMSVRKTLVSAGLGADRSVTPESIRRAGARAVYDNTPRDRRLLAAAAMLGTSDFNRVAVLVGHVPQTNFFVPPVQWEAANP
jgi:hypothetical protein